MLSDGDAQRARVDAHPHACPALDRFAVYVEEQRLIGFDGGLLDVADRAADLVEPAAGGS